MNRRDNLYTLPSGREVFDTGRVLVGSRYQPPAQDMGSEAERIQALMLAARESGGFVRDYADETARIPRNRSNIAIGVVLALAVLAVVSLTAAIAWLSGA